MPPPRSKEWTPKADPIRKLPYWGAFADKPLASRVSIAPEQILGYLRADNEFHGWPNKPFSARADAAFLKDFHDALESMPSSVHRLLRAKLAAVLLVEDLGGSAYTESIIDDHGRAVAGFVVLDVSAMNRRANEWATWKESTPFSPSAGYEIRATIETDSQNTRKQALQYILLHEFAHVLSIGTSYVPPQGEEVETLKPLLAYKFTRLSWRMEKQSFVSVHDAKFRDRNRIRYYQELPDAPALSEAPKIYEGLEKTDFPTLYAATNPHDDFAESFASYVHMKIQKRPWSLKILHNGKTTHEFAPCWGKPRCRHKEEVLKKLLAR